MAAPGAQLDATLHTMQQQLDAVQLQLNTMQLQLAALPAQLAALPAQVAALINAPAISGQIARNVQSVVSARGLNRHDRDAEPYTVVLREDGTAPPHWPVPPAAGFDRDALLRGPLALVDVLLADYGLAHGAAAGTSLARRNALARHIGTMQG